MASNATSPEVSAGDWDRSYVAHRAGFATKLGSFVLFGRPLAASQVRAVMELAKPQVAERITQIEIGFVCSFCFIAQVFAITVNWVRFFNLLSYIVAPFCSSIVEPSQ